ncbi:ATP-dependent RNA helicase dbp7 [Quaeritorhiza haematococci]|nr:ATP-dependent RNA helicase dbp7 [Quaeritorhiza haematococci]
MSKAEKEREMEMAATDVQMRFERVVANDPETLDLARRAFTSHIRAYATHTASQRQFFSIRSLHLGHVAKSFALREAPNEVVRSAARASGSSNKPTKSKRKKHTKGGDGSDDDEQGGGGSNKRARQMGGDDGESGVSAAARKMLNKRAAMMMKSGAGGLASEFGDGNVRAMFGGAGASGDKSAQQLRQQRDHNGDEQATRSQETHNFNATKISESNNPVQTTNPDMSSSSTPPKPLKHWSCHKLVCTISTKPIPGLSYPRTPGTTTGPIRALLFPEDEQRPRFVALQIKQTSNGGETIDVIDLDEYLGPSYKTRSVIFQNTLRKRKREDIIEVWYRDNFMNDGSKLNKSVIVSAEGMSSHRWAGPVLATRVPGLQAHLNDHCDLEVADFRDVADFFKTYGTITYF